MKLGPFLIDKYTAPGVSGDLMDKTYYYSFKLFP